ncbi:hypothetical protein SBI_04606 [Streptomyces bingchenggensis BCW-1]|uniref:Uncharacterized protein n=1 Tax=Streptomyces bingchenggensis (strain BCW-1) TaxID=749414 RepID=D7BXF3_STRBB|nr:hypothetical protein SBI_04606 [Streptomyces bingchenggensis BCW-1]
MPVGSSASTVPAPLTSARARATRCCSPADSSPGRWSARPARPTRSSSSRAARRAWCASPGRGSATLRRAECCGSRLAVWKTKPMRRRRRSARSLSLSCQTSRSSIRTEPESGGNSRPRICSRVVLPEPEWPTKAVIRPGAGHRSAPRSTSTRWSRSAKDLWTARASGGWGRGFTGVTRLPPAGGRSRRGSVFRPAFRSASAPAFRSAP